ncbi:MULTISPECIES: hypothetical protein [unclassified Streptomyces]|uniref:hypothetical protein n=1 Tax=unclassified Streptomyces TaxID=2593676 RepID=UPI001BE612D3|nr:MULTISPECIES: hypothetical protein [unclassified Streptomyces]MBT2406338.1 hypothetical protein [Streptomyces sp. ISL-21]MBT2607566.1 hypothetical protein [Streptomyces sp. ISL-87]
MDQLLKLLAMVEAALIVGLLRMIFDLLDGGVAPGIVRASLKTGSAWAFCTTLTLLILLFTAFR